MRSYVVALAEDLPPGSRRLAKVAGKEIGIFNLDGKLYAVRNRCPHEGGPLCAGRIVSGVDARVPGEYVLQVDTPVLQCPWHQWEFDLRTGRSWFDPAKVRARAYKAQVKSGETMVRERREAEEQPSSPRARAEVVEMYPVTRNGVYILIEA